MSGGFSSDRKVRHRENGEQTFPWMQSESLGGRFIIKMRGISPFPSELRG